MPTALHATGSCIAWLLAVLLFVLPGGAAAGQSSNSSVAPALNLPGLDGKPHALSEWRGKLVLLNFWATWCSPCISEIDELVALQSQYDSQGLQIIGVGMDEAGKLQNVQRTLEINYPVLVADPARNARLMLQWGNSSGIIPYTVVIDRDGVIRFSHHGPLSRELFTENILPLLSHP